MSKKIPLSTIYTPTTPSTPITTPYPSLTLSPSLPYETLSLTTAKAVSLITSTGDSYPFAPYTHIITDLAYLQAASNLDLSILDAPSITLSTILQTYDAVQHLIPLFNTTPSYLWYVTMVRETLTSYYTYTQSARGILDTLSTQSLLPHQLLLDRISTLDPAAQSALTSLLNLDPSSLKDILPSLQTKE